MALVDKDHMTELRPASDSRATAQDAEKDIQLMAVAYAINNAANTGETRTIFQGVLLDDVRTQLESKGYTVTNFGPAHPENRIIISWEA